MVPYPKGFIEDDAISARLAAATINPVWPELREIGERALTALNAVETGRELFAAGRMNAADLDAAEKEWAVLKVEFRNAVKRVGELVRVGLICLADTDPAAMVAILERAGLSEAAERLVAIENVAAGLTRDIEVMRQELDTYRAKTWGAFQLLNKLEAHADRVRYDLEQMEGKAGRKPKATWQDI